MDGISEKSVLDEHLEMLALGGVREKRSGEALLALVLLLQEMIAAGTFDRELAGAGDPDPLLGTAV